MNSEYLRSVVRQREWRFHLACAALLAISFGSCSTRSEGTADPSDNSATVTGSGESASECLTNADVVQLVVSGERDEAIIAHFSGATTCFELSTDKILDLRNAGVSPAVIAAMTRANRREDHGSR